MDRNDFTEKDMNRELIVSLLQKQIEELKLMTEGFMDMTTYPEAIIKLALIKNDDIREYLHQLNNSNLTNDIENAEFESALETEIIELIEEADRSIQETQNTVEQAIEADIVIIEEIQDDNQVEENEIVEEEIIVYIDEEENEETAENEDETTTTTTTESITEEIENQTNVEIENQTEVDEPELIEEFEDLEEEDEELADDKEDQTISDETPILTLTETEKTVRPTLTRNDILNGNDISLNSSIGSKKITDIRQAISIGDRFRFQRELFRNNGEDMNKTLIYINQLASFDEVFQFLQSKYGWETENSNAEDFYQIVKRKF